jgi:glycosyltransferase involved in cell wall biosynthesis
MSTVSIILPTYNRLQFLRCSVESVFGQSFTDWELVVADDGSAEGTRAYLRRLEAPRVRVLYLAHSGNPSRVRNAALAVAEGKYVAFLDSDDVWAASKLAKQVAALEASERCRWSYTACDRIDVAGKQLPSVPHTATAARGGWIFEPLLALEVAVAMPTLVAERTLIEEIGGFDEAQLYGEFHDLCLRLALRSEVVALADVLCSIRAHDQHYSADRTAAHRAWMRLYEKFHALAPTAATRTCCDRMRARAALDLAALQGANRDLAGVWRTLAAGEVWRRPSLWHRYSLALLRPLVPPSLKTTRVRPPRERGVMP